MPEVRRNLDTPCLPICEVPGSLNKVKQHSTYGTRFRLVEEAKYSVLGRPRVVGRMHFCCYFASLRLATARTSAVMVQ